MSNQVMLFWKKTLLLYFWHSSVPSSSIIWEKADISLCLINPYPNYLGMWINSTTCNRKICIHYFRGEIYLYQLPVFLAAFRLDFVTGVAFGVTDPFLWRLESSFLANLLKGSSSELSSLSSDAVQDRKTISVCYTWQHLPVNAERWNYLTFLLCINWFSRRQRGRFLRSFAKLYERLIVGAFICTQICNRYIQKHWTIHSTEKSEKYSWHIDDDIDTVTTCFLVVCAISSGWRVVYFLWFLSRCRDFQVYQRFVIGGDIWSYKRRRHKHNQFCTFCTQSL